MFPSLLPPAQCLCAILCNQPLPSVVNSPVNLNPEKYSIPIVLPLSECHVNEIIQYIAFSLLLIAFIKYNEFDLSLCC